MPDYKILGGLQSVHTDEVNAIIWLRIHRHDLIDELPVEKRHLSKLIIICRI